MNLNKVVFIELAFTLKINTNKIQRFPTPDVGLDESNVSQPPPLLSYYLCEYVCISCLVFCVLLRVHCVYKLTDHLTLQDLII